MSWLWFELGLKLILQMKEKNIIQIILVSSNNAPFKARQ